MTNSYLVTVVHKDHRELQIKLKTEQTIKNVQTLLQKDLENTKEHWINVANYFICKDDILLVRIDYDQHIKEGQDKKEQGDKV